MNQPHSTPTGTHHATPAPAHPHPHPHHPPHHVVPGEATLDPIGLVDDEPTPAAATEAAKKIKAFGAGTAQKSHDWKRKTTANGTGAVRCRSFHGKLSDQGLGFMDDMINEWLDSHPDVEVKFVTSTVGQYEGKIREPALVLNLWY